MVLFRHEEDELQEVIDELGGYLLPQSTVRDLRFTAAAKALPFVRAFITATKNPSWDTYKQAFDAAQPRTYHPVYHGDRDYDSLSESDEE